MAEMPAEKKKALQEAYKKWGASEHYKKAVAANKAIESEAPEAALLRVVSFSEFMAQNPDLATPTGIKFTATPGAAGAPASVSMNSDDPAVANSFHHEMGEVAKKKPEGAGGSMLDGIWNFIKSNGFGLGAALLGLFAGNAMDLGLLGIVAVAGIAFVGGSLLGDGDGGLLGGFLNNKPKVDLNSPLLEKGKAPTVPTLAKLETPTPEPTKPLNAAALEEIPADKAPTLPDGKKATHRFMVKVDENRFQEYVGVLDETKTKFSGVAISLHNNAKGEAEKAGGTMRTPVDLHGLTPIEFKVKKSLVGNLTGALEVEFDLETSKKLVEQGNKHREYYNDVKSGKVGGPAAKPKDLGVLKDDGKGLPAIKTAKEGELVSFVIEDAEGKTYVEGTCKGGDFIVTKTQTTPPTGTATEMVTFKEPVTVPLGDEKAPQSGTGFKKLIGAAVLKEKTSSPAPAPTANVTKVAATVTADAINITGEATQTGKPEAKAVNIAGKVDKATIVISGNGAVKVGDVVLNVDKPITVDITGVDMAAVGKGDKAALEALQKKLLENKDLNALIATNVNPSAGPLPGGKPKAKDSPTPGG